MTRPQSRLDRKALLLAPPQHPNYPALPVHQCRHNSTSAVPPKSPRLTHVDDAGKAHMVDVSAKEPTKRSATASGRIYVPQIAYELITEPPTPTSRGGDAREPEALGALERARRKARAKGDVLTVAQLAAIMGCKRTHEIIPLCHPLQLSHIAVTLHPECEHAVPERSPSESAHARGADGSPGATGARSPYSVLCVATVTCEGKTGVEMEALTAVSVGLLTVWDMLKAVAGREMIIGDITVIEKTGGKSGDFRREAL
ncbi:cyclic pyranopterin monophosphate synthase MoaC [Phanerochaete sordida]|uniref:Cyclic pyranopterin monophosphate synthase MoaC n=1 Tax=Phanerochaete sordida TaxID=48140 RepID=A0A9P3G875_9APHY|nr:cyclic pyranopterin monophosphate synthase MoaC [Phanerochaete sordida]